jgi:hypothetical protein
MTITLPPVLEDAVRRDADAQGVSPEELVQRVLAEHVSRNGTATANTSPPTIADDYFAEELATYERHRADLERDHMGKVALLRGRELVGVHSTLEAADRDGVARFGLQKFMLYEIGDPVHVVLPGIY